MIASDVTDLPQPDSPTEADRLARRDGERHAVDGADAAARPRRVKCTDRSSTSSSGLPRAGAGAGPSAWSLVDVVMPASPPELRVEGLAQRLTQQVKPRAMMMMQSAG